MTASDNGDRLHYTDNLMRPILLLMLSLTLALLSTVLFSALVINLSANDLQQLILVMVGTGISTTLMSYGLYRAGLLRWLRSLRWTLLLIVLFTVALILVNMWALARLMFLSSHYLSGAVLMLLFAGLAATGFGFFVSKTMIDRLHQLDAAAGRVAEGDLTTRLDVAGNDEIARLAHSFNSMARSLQEVDEAKRRLEQTRRDLVAWVSHDLRTPLTSMRVMLEAMADGMVSDPETTQRYLKSSLGEIEHLSHLIDDLFDLAQLDVGHLKLDFQPTSLRDLVSDTLGSMMPRARSRQIHLSGQVELDDDLITIAPDKIQRVLYNLVQNAITYTPAGEAVTIRVSREHASQPVPAVRVDVANSGVHIPQEELPNLFQSFYRGEKSRRAQDGERGVGLGLAIARGFVQAHGGHIWAESSPEVGTVFSFVIPATHIPHAEITHRT